MEVAGKGLQAALLGAACLPALAGGLRAANLESLFLDDQAALAGGAVVAAGSEAGSAWYNPAGLAMVERPQVKLGASAYVARFYWIPKFNQVKLPDADGSLELKTRSFFSTPSSLVYATRLGPKLSGAFAVFTRDQLDVLEVNSQTFSGINPAGGNKEYSFETGGELDMRLKNYVAGPALGWRPASWLRLGLGAFGEYARVGFVTRYFQDYYHKDSFNPATGFYDLRMSMSADQRQAVSQIALRGNGGAQIDLGKDWSLGLALHSPAFRLYTETSIDIVLDGSATTQAASYPGGIVVHYHFKGEQAEHLYSWDQPYRAFAGLARKLGRGGYVSAEADFSDLAAERGRGGVWNFRLGGLAALNDAWSLGCGAYTDLRAPGVDMRQFGSTSVDYYGATLGLRYATRFKASPEEEEGSPAEARPMLMTTTFSLHYNRGFGEYAGQRTDAIKFNFPIPVGPTDFLQEEYSAHLGGGFIF